MIMPPDIGRASPQELMTWPNGPARMNRIKAATVPIWLTISTGRRPYRSDRRPSQGAARNWAAKNEVDSSVIWRMDPPNCPSA